MKLINWFEIPALDLKRAVGFYSELFELSLTLCDCGEEQMAFFPEDQCNVPGAISKAPGFTPAEHGPVIYFNADGKLDRLIKKTKKLGGEILMGNTKIQAEGRGSFALIKDTEGNRIGLYQE